MHRQAGASVRSTQPLLRCRLQTIHSNKLTIRSPSPLWQFLTRDHELPTIIGALQEHIEHEEERLRREREETYRRHQEEERIRLQQRFLAGADCGWTQIEKSDAFYCRRNGRAFRVARAKDKRWNLYRIAAQDDAGVLLGTYQGRREASKALEKIAHEPEPHW